MKYSNEILINQNIHKVVELFDSVDNMYKWMPGLVSVEHISGTQGEVGSKSKLKFKMKNREVEIVETIIAKNLPSEFSGTYEMKGTYNTVKNSFAIVSENQTKYISESEFKFSGIMMKIFGLLVPGTFKKQSFKYMHLFKEFAENQRD